jgi:hypothetical protein
MARLDIDLDTAEQFRNLNHNWDKIVYKKSKKPILSFLFVYISKISLVFKNLLKKPKKKRVRLSALDSFD